LEVANGELRAGTVIEGFTLDGKLHQGGMSTLWKVSRADIELPLLMKIPRAAYGDGPAAIVGFEVEQMILPTLTGIHVPRVVAKGDHEGLPYIVMEHISGGSLRERLDTIPFALGEVAALGAKIATALHDVHRQHVVHLDIKPSSILFRESGEAVLIDFGLAHHKHLPDLLAEEFHLPIGTGPYISPEQVVGMRDDPRSDVFALGVTLYYLLTGERPFGNPVSVRGLRRRLYRDPAPPRQLRPECPHWLQEILLRCLEVAPGARYGSASQLAFDLRHPEHVTLTDRAHRISRDGATQIARRWFKTKFPEPSTETQDTGKTPVAPIVMAAIDIVAGAEALADQLRAEVHRVLQTHPGARLACVHVRRTARVAIDVNVDDEGHSLHAQRLAALKHWARPLQAYANRITFHVLETHDVAEGILDFANSNHIDHVVMGARGSSLLRRYLGSVSSQVVAGATCTVTVVRTGPPTD
jgi:nucleotide-binding universal stress UspA family protein